MYVSNYNIKNLWPIQAAWNSKIYNLYRVLNIVYDIKIRRLGWVGHIIRKEDERIPKKVLNGKVHNTRPVGKSRKDTSQILGIRRWGQQKTEKNGGIF